jgi:hypothetical protein
LRLWLQVCTLACMATKTTVVLVDDLSGDPADTTVTFALDSTTYEIDLSDDNADQLRDAFARYIKAARKVSSSAGRRGAPAAKPAYSGYDPAAVRAWATGNRIEVSARGRIKADVVEQYRAAGN